MEEEEKTKGGCDNGFILHTGETKLFFFKADKQDMEVYLKL